MLYPLSYERRRQHSLRHRGRGLCASALADMLGGATPRPDDLDRASIEMREVSPRADRSPQTQ